MSEQSQSDESGGGVSKVSAVVEGRPRLIGIMRHARVQVAQTPAELTEPTEFFRDDQSSAERDLTGIGAALAEVLDGRPDDDGIARLLVIHEDTDHAHLTATTLTEAYDQAVRKNVRGRPRTAGIDRSDLDNPSAYASALQIEDWLDKWRAMFALEPDGASTADDLMVIYVGHDPAMSWLATSLLGNDKRRPWNRFMPQVPGLNHTEVLVLERSDSGRYRAAWSLGPADDKAAKALADKVKSKMDTAKVFAGVLTAVTAFAADNIRSLKGHDQAIALAGLGLLGFAIILYLITMFFYDSLLMPRRFWSSGRPKSKRRWWSGTRPNRANQPNRTNPSNRLARPPSSGTVVLYQNMVLVWSRVFVPATFVAGLGLAAYVFAAAEMQTWTERTIFMVVAAWSAAVAAAFGWSGRPRLGVSD